MGWVLARARERGWEQAAMGWVLARAREQGRERRWATAQKVWALGRGQGRWRWRELGGEKGVRTAGIEWGTSYRGKDRFFPPLWGLLVGFRWGFAAGGCVLAAKKTVQ
jgi:hypothetical protein